MGQQSGLFAGDGGYDNTVAGFNTLLSGKPSATWGGQLLQAAGLSPEVAEALYALTQLGAALGLRQSSRRMGLLISDLRLHEQVVESFSTHGYQIRSPGSGMSQQF